MRNYFIPEPIGKEEGTKIYIYFSSNGNINEKVSRWRMLKFWVVNKILQSLKIRIEVREKIIAPQPYRQEEIEAEEYNTKDILRKEMLDRIEETDREIDTISLNKESL